MKNVAGFRSGRTHIIARALLAGTVISGLGTLVVIDIDRLDSIHWTLISIERTALKMCAGQGGMTSRIDAVATELAQHHDEPIRPGDAVSESSGGGQVLQTAAARSAETVNVQDIACSASPVDPPEIDPDQALREAQSLIARNPEDRKILRTAASLAEAAGIAPSLSAESHAVRARAAELAGDTVTARQEYEQALSVAPASGDYHRRYGFLLVDLGLWREALEQLDAALQFSPSADSETRYLHALALAGCGMTEEAATEMEEISDSDPELRGVAAKAEELRRKSLGEAAGARAPRESSND